MKKTILLLALGLLCQPLYPQRTEYPQIGAQVFIEPGQTDKQIDGFFRILAQHGFETARIRMFGAHMLRPDGSWDFTLYDKAFDAAGKHCVKLFATLFPPTDELGDVDGIIVPGGFGDRGIEGMIQAAQYARENQIPYFGICLGMQIMVMEFARGVLGYADANSSEFTPDGAHNVIALMADQQGNIPKGGTMRLGKYPCTVKPGTKMAECYGEAEIWERHRHRYEFNNEFRQEMEDAGLVISGTSPDGRLVETVELPGRDFHLGAQFHPEFKSRPTNPQPLFREFVRASIGQHEGVDRLQVTPMNLATD